MRRKRTTGILALAIAMMAVLISGQLSPARAELAAVSPATTNVLLTFPNWYADKAGVGLAQCNFDGGGADVNCIAGAPLPGFEAFFFAADPPVGSLDGGNASNVIVVMGIESVPGTDLTPGAPGVVFARIRVRANLLGPGVYTLTHPYGVQTYNIVTPGIRAINDTVDFPIPDLGLASDFTTVLAGTIGPFLTCVNPAPPAGYIGNYGVPCTFTGSPLGQNLVRLAGPGTDNVSTQLHISGKIDPAVTAPPLAVTSATYTCAGGACQATVLAAADPTALLTATAAGVTANMTPVPGTPGGFTGTMLIPQTQIPLPVDGLNTFPVQALVVANQAGFVGTLTAVEKRMSLVDTVTITQATLNTATGILTVSAKSGDPRATMSAAPFGAFTGAQMFFDLDGFGGVPIPAATVTVNSTGGGTATAPTSTISVPEKLKVTAATFNARRRRLTVVGTSSAKGATIVLRSITNPLGTGAVVNAKGGFKAIARVNRKPRFARVISSGGKSVRATVR